VNVTSPKPQLRFQVKKELTHLKQQPLPRQHHTMATTTTLPEKAKERPTALRSIIAGSTAGAVEIGMFYVFPGHSSSKLRILFQRTLS
jgi:hypothetical protein